MRIDWLSKLRHLLQVMAFCLAVSAIQLAFDPGRPYAPSAVYALWIGLLTWATIDLGRHAFASAAETGWPKGWAAWLLPLGGIFLGYLVGNFLADSTCRTFNLYSGPPPGPQAALRDLMVSAIAGVVGTTYFYGIHKSAYLERKVDEAVEHATEARLKLLEAQLEPHMLFNTLANLRALIAVDPQRAQTMLDHMIAYLRATLGASRGTTHSLRAEFDRLRDYLELMAIRMGPRLSYALDLPVDLAAELVPTLLLQPLVENSIQHGLEPKVQGGRVDVRARREGGALVLEVSDTGVGTGHAPDQAEQISQGFGIAQVRERLATLHGGAASLAFTSAPGNGTHAIIRIPLSA